MIHEYEVHDYSDNPRIPTIHVFMIFPVRGMTASEQFSDADGLCKDLKRAELWAVLQHEHLTPEGVFAKPTFSRDFVAAYKDGMVTESEARA